MIISMFSYDCAHNALRQSASLPLRLYVGTTIETSSPDSISIIPKATSLRPVAHHSGRIMKKSFEQTDGGLTCGDAPGAVQHQSMWIKIRPTPI
jgi:hypothetical protein